MNCCPLLLYHKNDSIDRLCRQTSHSEDEQALQRRLDEVTGELRTERSKSGSLQATLEKSQQDGDALAGEKGQQDTPRFFPKQCGTVAMDGDGCLCTVTLTPCRVPAAHWETGGRARGALCPVGCPHRPGERGAGGENPTGGESGFGQLSPGGQSGR